MLGEGQFPQAKPATALPTPQVKRKMALGNSVCPLGIISVIKLLTAGFIEHLLCPTPMLGDLRHLISSSQQQFYYPHFLDGKLTLGEVKLGGVRGGIKTV